MAAIVARLRDVGALPDGGRDDPNPKLLRGDRLATDKSGRPATNIRFSNATAMAASVRWAAKPRAHSRGPISVL